MKVPQFMPFIGDEEYAEIKSCFDSTWITEGPKSKEFAEKLCKIIGCKYGVFAPNGTLALYLGLRAIGIGPGDEVIVPDFTFIASANAVEMTGAKPVFVDVDFHCQIDVNRCREVLTDKTKAIMPVHMYGMASNMPEVSDFAKTHNLLVIEDSAQALGVKYNSIGCGSWGDVGCFSFFADKTITTGEGGFVTTNNDETYSALRYLRNQGRLNRGTFEHPKIGYNFRMTDLQAAVGLAQLRKFQTIVNKKLEAFRKYSTMIPDNCAVISPSKHSTCIPFRVVVMTPLKSSVVLAGFSERGVEGRGCFYPLHKQPCYRQYNCVDENYPVSNRLYDSGVCLPSFTSISDAEIEYICKCLAEIVGEGK